MKYDNPLHQSTVKIGATAEPRFVESVDAKWINADLCVVTIKAEKLSQYGMGKAKTVTLYLNADDAGDIGLIINKGPHDT